MLTHFKVPLLANFIALVAVFCIWGWAAALVVLLLTVLEVTFSFDNAVVNSATLKKMDKKWQTLFLTLGILIAVFGMRLVFPVLIVSFTAGLSPWAALQLAIHNPHSYSEHLHHAHGSIAAFGGMFLLMLFLTWVTDKKEHYWLPVERWLESRSSWIYLIGFIVAIALPGPADAAILGIALYYLLSKADVLLEKVHLSAGLGLFLYLEVLDASFSFDGVIGAFALTSNIFLIMIGLGIGAAYVRSMTVYLTNSGKLAEYRYLEHGAHWAILCLSVLLLLSIKVSIPDVLTGIIGVVVIAAAFYHSLKINRRQNAKIHYQELDALGKK